jgi:hypothetical protein
VGYREIGQNGMSWSPPGALQQALRDIVIGRVRRYLNFLASRCGTIVRYRMDIQLD